jgi:hypothetical protein
MVQPQIKPLTPPQRVEAQIESDESGQRVRIRVENYDEGLGWYPAASILLPLNQLPVLEQAVEDMRRSCHCFKESEASNIISFPGLPA